MNRARVIFNDAGQTLDGNLLANTKPYTLEYLNEGYQYLQEELANSGVETFVKETQLLNVTPITILDPALETYISFTGYYDGSQMFDTPVLPVDLLMPLRLWERPYNTFQQYCQMFPVNDGLPVQAQTIMLRYWDWRQDQLFFKGALQANDIRMRYIFYLPDLPEDPDHPGQPDPNYLVPIVRCQNSLALYVAAAFAGARGGPLRDELLAKAESAVYLMTNRTARKRQRGAHRRIPYSRRGYGNSSTNFW